MSNKFKPTHNLITPLDVLIPVIVNGNDIFTQADWIFNNPPSWTFNSSDGLLLNNEVMYNYGIVKIED